MSKIQLLAVKPKRKPWNKGCVVGQKRPLLPKQVWAIRKRYADPLLPFLI